PPQGRLRPSSRAIEASAKKNAGTIEQPALSFPDVRFRSHPGYRVPASAPQRTRERAWAQRLRQIIVHAGCACARRLLGAAAARRANVPPGSAVSRTNAAGPFEPVDAGQGHIHEHRVVFLARSGLDCGLAGADEIGAMAKLGKDGVEHDAPVRIVL